MCYFGIEFSFSNLSVGKAPAVFRKLNKSGALLLLFIICGTISFDDVIHSLRLPSSCFVIICNEKCNSCKTEAAGAYPTSHYFMYK